jgi:tRNA modification GTPase
VVRLTGPRAREIARDVPGAVVRRAPRSFTREDLVEIHLPGSAPLVDALLARLVALGARPARPGEFTLRAFLNGRIDLAQAEAVERLVAAEDAEERRAALAQLEGEMSGRLARIEEGLLDLRADVEASIDFAGEDIEIVSEAAARGRASALLAELRALRADCSLSRTRDERPTVALYGPPNAGKSTLFNALAGADALVSPMAGTTRDVLAADLDLGVPARLLDSAGVRPSPDGELEAEGARRAKAAMEAADLVLLVADASDRAAASPPLPPGVPFLLVLNKTDLADAGAAGGIAVSAKTGAGLAELRAAIRRRLAGGPAGGRFRVSLRQQAALADAEAALDRALAASGAEFAALDLRAAVAALGAVSGRDVGEELLDRIFSRFCLGK